MSEQTYTVRVNPEGTAYYSYALAGAVEVDFTAALDAARRVSDADSWSITRAADGVIIAQYDATELDAMLWRNYRRSELAAQRRAEVEARLKPRCDAERVALERDIRRAKREVVERSTEHSADRQWRTMRNIRLMNAIEEAVLP